jgi:cell division transport system permease protein
MIALLLPPPSLRRLLPDQKKRVAPWIVGLMTFVSLIVGAVGLGVLGAVSDLRDASEGRWSLQVTGVAADAARARAWLSAAPEVTSVEPVPEAEVRRTLSDWLGPAAGTLDLPLPALADVTLGEGKDGDALAQRLEKAVPTARLTPYSAEMAPLLGSLRALSILVLGLLLVLGLAMAAAVTLAARATLETNRSTLDVFHGIGATDAQLLSLLQRRIAIDALLGGALGGLSAALVLALALVPARSFLGELGGPGLLGTSDLLLLFLLPLLQALLATMVARRALRKALADIT